jgi:hypothetical protein
MLYKVRSCFCLGRNAEDRPSRFILYSSSCHGTLSIGNNIVPTGEIFAVGTTGSTVANYNCTHFQPRTPRKTDFCGTDEAEDKKI